MTIDHESCVMRLVRADEVWPLFCRESFIPCSPDVRAKHPDTLGYDIETMRMIVLLPGETVDWDAMRVAAINDVASELRLT